jgi:hypothetical protein
MAAKVQAARKKAVKSSRKRSESSSQITFAVSYFEELAEPLDANELAKNISIYGALERQGRFLVSPETEFSYLSQTAALSGIDRLKGFFDRFTTSAGKAKTEISKLYELFGEARMQIEKNLDVVKLVLNSDGSNDGRKLDNLIVQYLVSGSCPTRLGEEIKLPDEDSKDKTLDTLLGILRIICEHTWDTKNPDTLPWLADDTSDSARRFIKYESKAGELGDRMASSTGRAAAVGATSLINQLVKLPDEISTVIAFIAGVNGRKIAEVTMHQYLVNNPNVS